MTFTDTLQPWNRFATENRLLRYAREGQQICSQDQNEGSSQR